MLVRADYLSLVFHVLTLVVIQRPASRVHRQTAPRRKPKYDTTIT